jgi:hypothetical protein
MLQVRVKVWNHVFTRYEYLFEEEKAQWEPVFGADAVCAGQEDEGLLRSLGLVPPEDREWFPVTGLQPAPTTGSVAYRRALRETSPDSGSFILLSPRRRVIARGEEG